MFNLWKSTGTKVSKVEEKHYMDIFYHFTHVSHLLWRLAHDVMKNMPFKLKKIELISKPYVFALFQSLSHICFLKQKMHSVWMAAYTVCNVSKSMKCIIVEIMGLVYQHRQKRKNRTQASSVIFAFFSLQTHFPSTRGNWFSGVAAMWRWKTIRKTLNRCCNYLSCERMLQHTMLLYFLPFFVPLRRTIVS